MHASRVRIGILSASVALVSAVVVALLAGGPAGADDTWQWFQTDTHGHSVIGSDGTVDYGILAAAYQSRGYDAVFVTDHQGGSSFGIGGATANNATLDDTYERFDPDAAGTLTSSTNQFVSSPVRTGVASLQLSASSANQGEAFVLRERGPNLRSGTITLNFSVYPTRIDPGSGLYVSLSIGGDPVESTDGYTTAAGVVSPGKHTILVWQLGTPVAPSADPDARVITHDLAYSMDEWNTYSIDVTAAMAAIPEVDRPLDYNAITMLKLSAAANTGTAVGFFDSLSMFPSAPVPAAEEFTHRTSVIDDFDSASFKLFPGLEQGTFRHTSRFDYAIAAPGDYRPEIAQGINGISATHAAGYPAQLNHPGRPGGVTKSEAIANLAYGADLMEVRNDVTPVMIQTWDAILAQGHQVLGTWGTDAHAVSTLDVADRGVATHVYASSLALDPLLRSLYEGRTYLARNGFAGQLLFGPDAGTASPFPARYPIHVPEGLPTADLHLSIDAGVPAGAQVVWIQDGSTIATDATTGSTYAASRSIDVSGSGPTSVRAELRDASGGLLAMTQPIFFRDVEGLPVGTRYHTEGVGTPDGRGYTNALTKGVVTSTWDAQAHDLAVTLEAPAGALAEVTVDAPLEPAVFRVDASPIGASPSMAAFTAATTSAWFFDAAAQRIHLKVLHATTSATAQLTFHDPAGAPVVALVGDIACDPADPNFNDGLGTPSRCRQLSVSNLLVDAGLDAVLTLGDHQYDCGGAAAWEQSYELSWGRVKDITRPSVGHHEYSGGGSGTDCDPAADATSYFDYFNGVGNADGPAGTRGQGWYSFDLGSWHIISFNSVCNPIGGCDFGDPEMLWLQADLAASSTHCTLAYMHGPRWSTAEKDNNDDLADMVQALYDAGADVIVGGHAHNYQRFAPQDPAANLDLAHGIRQFVVGTGGKNIHEGDFLPGVPNWEVWDDTSFGVLEMTLHPDRYEFAFVPEVGGTGAFTDSGSQACHGAPPGEPDTTPPSVPTDVAAVAVSSGQVDLSWTASVDDRVVGGYTVRRDDVEVSTVGGSTLTYSDATVHAETTYRYTVEAVDAAANRSAPSAPAVVTTPEPPPTVTFRPTADAFVSAVAPVSNFGADSRLYTDASPIRNSYVRFNLSGIGDVQSATLRVHAETTNGTGFDVREVSNTSWPEFAITYDNAPALGPIIGSSTLSAGAGYYEVDVTSVVAGPGPVSFGIVSTDTRSTRYSSRESATPPELVVLTGVVNTPPEAVDDAITVAEDSIQNPVHVLGNDADAESDPLTITALSDPPNGSVAVNDNGTPADPADDFVDYTPDAGRVGTDSFTYTINDGTPGNDDTATVDVVVEPAATSYQFPAVADAYVRSSTPAGNFGSLTRLRTDGSPDIDSYLRFDVRGVLGTITSATLRVHATSALSGSVAAHRVADTKWTESGITYANAPGLGPFIGSVGPIAADTWVEFDVTAELDGNGDYAFGLTSADRRALSLWSRQGTLPPELVIDVVGSPTVTSVSVAPIADAYVSSSAPTANLGSLTKLRTDGSPDIDSFLLFDVQSILGPVATATLRLHTTSALSGSINAHAVEDAGWSESDITYANAPGLGAHLGAAGPVQADTWMEFDVTAAVADNGLHSFGLTSSSSTALAMWSREGTVAPELTITVIASSGDPG